MGNTCKPMAVSFQCMTKPTTKKKKKKYRKKKKKKDKNHCLIWQLTIPLPSAKKSCPKKIPGASPVKTSHFYGHDTWA